MQVPPEMTQQLFQPEWEIDDLQNQKVAHVVLTNTGTISALTYLVPEHLNGTVAAGKRVTVPLGKNNRSVIGYCVAVANIDDFTIKYKPILSVLDEQVLISGKMLELCRWISEYHLCPLGQVLECVLPAGVRTQAGTRLTKVLFLTGRITNQINISAKQQHIINTLKETAEPLTMMELQRTAKCSAAPINALKQLGILATKMLRRDNAAKSSPPEERAMDLTPPPILNADQKRCLDMINKTSNRYQTLLLHGVTGSGKTEVYIQAITAAVQLGKQAIVLVPEISLTPQTVKRFQDRFANVAVLHSHLTDSERHRQWSAIASGEVQVVVGARSAVFAPLPKLGMIIIDEEHENSFKQDSAPRYHTRDVARKRAELENIPLILGSATPSLESYYASNTDIPSGITLLSMPYRVMNRPLPYVEIVDLREAVRQRLTRGAIHRQLHTGIAEALQNGGQVILLLNRRGYSTHIQCPACGEAVKCPNCDVSLTHHKSGEIALCHYCDFQIPSPAFCPKCGFHGINYWGFGTQKLEMEVKSRFPDVPVLRMDTDTMQGHGAYEKALSAFRSGEIRILLGTQMIAKGLDFPNVTLVGVINADTALHLPDFRAAERTFHLITQVAGRTGRGEKGGKVIVQTFTPDHPAIAAASKHDYASFVRQELPMRKMLGYPPFTKMTRIVVRGENENKTFSYAETMAEVIRKTGAAENNVSGQEMLPALKILGPAPAPFAKLRNLYRFHIHLHCIDGNHLRQIVKAAAAQLKPPPEIQYIIDVDPVDML